MKRLMIFRGEHAAVLASGAGEVSSELFLKEGSRGSTSPRHRRRSERAPTKTFSKMIHRLKEDVRSWYELHRRNGATNVVVWAIYLQLALMLVLLVLLPFDTVQVGGRYRLIKPLNFTMSMAMYLATVVILLDYLRVSMWWKKVIGWGVSICLLTAITCITMQAARGTTSHFNNSTPFNSAVSSVMDIADPLNGVFVVVLLIFALQGKYDVSRSSQLGIAFGLFIFLAGSAIGGIMVAHRTECGGRCAWGSRAAGGQLEHHGGRFQGRALLGYPRITDFADSGLAYPSAESSAHASKADSRCCRLRRVRLAHGICVHAGHERCAARENVRLQGSPGWGRARPGIALQNRNLTDDAAGRNDFISSKEWPSLRIGPSG